MKLNMVMGIGNATSSSRNSKIKSTKGCCVSHLSTSKGPTSSPSSPSSVGSNLNHKKKQLKLERKMQMEQRNQCHRFMLRMVLLFYFILVTTIVVFYISSNPQQFYFMWSNASLASVNQPSMKDILLLKQRQSLSTSSSSSASSSSSSSVLSNNNHQDGEEFVEVGVGQSAIIAEAAAAAAAASTTASQPTATKPNTAASMVEGKRLRSQTAAEAKPLPSFAFQTGEVLGVGFIQCSTIHGLGGVPPASSSSSTSAKNNGNMDENGIPISNIVMPQSSYYSNDVIFLGRRFFHNNQFITRELKYGGNVPVIESDIERRAIYDYCRTAEEEVGYIDSIIALDLDHTTSTLYILNILKELLRVRRISALPVAAIVTPEQSSQTILDWIMYGDRYTLMNHVARHWIPISAGPYILQTLADDQYEDGISSPATDEFSRKDKNDTKMDTNMGPSISIPSSSIFRQIDQWPMLMISGFDDTISQTAGELIASSEEYHSMDTTKHSIIPGNTTCYLYHASFVIVAIIDYLQEWNERHPVDDGDYSDNYNDMMVTSDDGDTMYDNQYYSVKNDEAEEALCQEDHYLQNSHVPYVANIFPVG